MVCRLHTWAHLMVLGTGAAAGFAGALIPFKGLPLYLLGSVKAVTGASVDIQKAAPKLALKLL